MHKPRELPALSVFHTRTPALELGERVVKKIAARSLTPLFEAHQPRRQTWRDWTFLLLIALGVVLVIAIPVALLLWCIAWLLQQ